MDTSRNVVKRHQFADYLNTQTADTQTIVSWA